MNIARLLLYSRLLLLEITLHSSSGLFSMAVGAPRSVIFCSVWRRMMDPARHHGVLQQLLHPLSSPAHLSFSYSFTPKGWSSHHHRTPDAPEVPGRLRSTALSLLPQADEQELYPPLAENDWKHASLLGKVLSNKCQIHMGKELVPISGTTASHMHN